jgi:type IV pilus assembly protein PilW
MSTPSMTTRSFQRGARRTVGGFNLVELMIAMVLGLLLSMGLVSLFNATNMTGRVQDALARIQENGRYAVTRIESDLRMMNGQFRSNSNPMNWRPTGNGPVYRSAAPIVNTTASVGFPDLVVEAPAGWPANTVYPLSSRFFVQGYECGSGECSPAVPAAPFLPAVGAGAGDRVRGADVLTLRYQRGTGWSYRIVDPSVVPPQLELVPGDGDDALNFESGDLALLSDCSGSTIVQVEAAGTVLTPTNLIESDQFRPSPGTGACDPRVFNFTRNFISITYWLRLDADPAVDGRLVPVLIRNEDDRVQELVQGVERLDFLYGVQSTGGAMTYLTADEVGNLSDNATCFPPANRFEHVLGTTYLEPGCMWRTVRSVEVHALFNTVNDLRTMAVADTAYRYSIDGTADPEPPGATMPVTELPSGRMLRKEFISLLSVRNGNQ